MKILPSTKWTNVAFWYASSMEMSSIRASRHFLSSLSRTNAPGNNMCGLLSSLFASGAAGRPPWVWIAGRSCMWFFSSNRESLFQTRSLAKIGNISNAHRVGDRLLRECRPASDRRHEKRLMVMALERLVGGARTERCLVFRSVRQLEWSPAGQ
jgi:hypothetical protein